MAVRGPATGIRLRSDWRDHCVDDFSDGGSNTTNIIGRPRHGA